MRERPTHGGGAELPPDLRAIVRYACQAANLDMHAEFEARNGDALRALVEDHGVDVREFPADVLAELKRVAFEILEEQAAADPMSARVWAAQKAFPQQVREIRLSDPGRITEAMTTRAITAEGRGWVWEEHGVILGFSIAWDANPSIWALFVLPGREVRLELGRPA